jgi:hypothetical protein
MMILLTPLKGTHIQAPVCVAVAETGNATAAYTNAIAIVQKL